LTGEGWGEGEEGCYNPSRKIPPPYILPLEGGGKLKEGVRSYPPARGGEDT